MMSDRGLYPLEDLKRDFAECPVGFRCPSCKSVGCRVRTEGSGLSRVWFMRCSCGAEWSFSERWRVSEVARLKEVAEFNESVMGPIRDRAAEREVGDE